MEHVEERLAVAHGWHRAFRMWIRDWRDTVEQPGLMMGLDRAVQPFERHFCSKFGSHFLAGGPACGDLEFVKAGTLDDPSWAVPALHIWCEEKLTWLELPEDAAQVPRNP